MPLLKSFVGLLLLSASLTQPLFGQQLPKRAQHRDAEAMDILTRVLQAAGGAQAIAAIHDMTEKGEIAFYWGKDVKGPATIKAVGGSRFKMEADLPDGKSIWVVSEGIGSKWKSTEEGEKISPLSTENAANLANLTFPINHVTAALNESDTQISFVGIEKREGRSIYRVRVKGRLGVTTRTTPAGSVSKDLLIDALTFDIVSVEDHPYRTYGPHGHADEIAPREIDFADVRTVDGLQVPFSISTKLHGQRALSVHLTQVTVNSNIGDEEFQIAK
jgi:hypothetical protein